MRRPRPRLSALLILSVVGVGCAHADEGRSAPVAALGEGLRGDEAPVAAAEPPAEPPSGAVQTIDFGAEDVAPEPTTQVRGAPPRPKLPRMRLFGTRASDGP